MRVLGYKKNATTAANNDFGNVAKQYNNPLRAWLTLLNAHVSHSLLLKLLRFKARDLQRLESLSLLFASDASIDWLSLCGIKTTNKMESVLIVNLIVYINHFVLP